MSTINPAKAAATTVVKVVRAPLTSVGTAFWWAIGLTAVPVLLSLWLPGRPNDPA